MLLAKQCPTDAAKERKRDDLSDNETTAYYELLASNHLCQAIAFLSRSDKKRCYGELQVELENENLHERKANLPRHKVKALLERIQNQVCPPDTNTMAFCTQITTKNVFQVWPNTT